MTNIKSLKNNDSNENQSSKTARQLMIHIPKRNKGKQSATAQIAYDVEMVAFFKAIKKIDATLPFKVSSRGWCYILEDHGLTKGNFKSAEDLINAGRKTGLLPIDFTAKDGSRAFECIEYVDEGTPEDEADFILKSAFTGHTRYNPLPFWDYQHYYLELIVEKVDLKSLFNPLCRKYCIPVANAKGWSDINMRAEMIERFKYWEDKGKTPVLLYCGDHDPAGINISNLIKKNLNDLQQATGWNADNLSIDRFGLNYDFIIANNLSWIDNLETGAGKDLASPKHPDHGKAWVQDYIKAYGDRKVEANALVVRIEAGIELFKSTLDKYLDYEAIEQRQDDTFEQQSQVSLLVRQLMKAA